jgi:hypothetical protein
MTTEAYIPSAVTYGGRRLDSVVVVTLYDPDSDDPHGAVTTPAPLAAGDRGGPLVVIGTRDQHTWRLTLPEIEVCRSTAVGFEFVVFGRVQREPAADAP